VINKGGASKALTEYGTHLHRVCLFENYYKFDLLPL